MTNELCFYCDLPMRKRGQEKMIFKNALSTNGNENIKRLLRYCLMTKEHLVKKEDGGSNHKSNIVYAHAYCNSSRLDRTVENHKEIIMAMVSGGYHPLTQLKRIRE